MEKGIKVRLLKKFILKMVVIIISLITLSGCENNFNYTEGRVYSENTLPNSHSTDQNEEVREYVTKEEAINKSLDIFKNGFKLDIDRNSLNEEVNLYKWDSEFQWNVSWSKSEFIEMIEIYYQYYIRMNSITGEIIEIRVVNTTYESNDIDNYGETNFSQSKIKETIMPLSVALGIEIDDFYIVTEEEYGMINVKLVKGKDTVYHKFQIDKYTKSLASYSRHN